MEQQLHWSNSHTHGKQLKWNCEKTITSYRIIILSSIAILMCIVQGMSLWISIYLVMFQSLHFSCKSEILQSRVQRSNYVQHTNPSIVHQSIKKSERDTISRCYAKILPKFLGYVLRFRGLDMASWYAFEE